MQWSVKTERWEKKTKFDGDVDILGAWQMERWEKKMKLDGDVDILGARLFLQGKRL